MPIEKQSGKSWKHWREVRKYSLARAIAAIAYQVESMLAALNRLTQSQSVSEYIKMQRELIEDILKYLDKFEKTGDWFHFSLALDALDDLKREIENQ